MVGPLSSEEIDDVVSSVRRLVSNEQKPRPLSRDLNSERLVLTPALRVLAESNPLSTLLLATPVAEPAHAETDTETDTDADDRHAQPATSVWAEGEGDAVLVEADWEDDIWTEADPPLAEVALGAEVAEVLTATTTDLPDAPASPDRAEADWSGAAPIPFLPLRRRAEILAAKLAEDVLLQEAPTAVGSPVGEAEVSIAADERLAEMLAGAAAAMPTGADLSDPEPDDLAFAQMDDAASDFVAGSEDHVEDPAPDHDATAELVDADGAPIDVLDETALQDIVRQMIREELQGPLGERITRNVRKLVRAEINRALIARDLD